MAVPGMEQLLVERHLIAQKQQAFGIRVQPANGIDLLRKPKFSQCAIGGTVGSELGNHAVGFVEGD